MADSYAGDEQNTNLGAGRSEAEVGSGRYFAGSVGEGVDIVVVFLSRLGVGRGGFAG